jgi:predicted AlkP superfamily phosphohydrolase/phosphomutase
LEENLMNYTTTSPGKSKLVFFGLDGGDPDLIMQWIRSGDLPHLSRLCDSGTVIPCSATEVEGDGAAWISLATATSVGRHGVYFTEQIKPGTYTLEPINEDRACFASTIWQRLDSVGVKSIIIDMFRAPLSKHFTGTQINDWLSSYRTSPPRSTPSSLIKQLIHRYGDDPFQGNCDKWFVQYKDFDKLLQLCLSRVITKTEAVKDLIRHKEWDLLMIGFADVHDISHMCWHLHANPSLSNETDPVKEVYRSIDASMGNILAALPPGGHVFVFAGMGFSPFYTGSHLLDSILRLIENGTNTYNEYKIDTAEHFIYRNRFVIPLSIRDKLWPIFHRTMEFFRKRDRMRRKFFAVPLEFHAGAIRINLAGREPSGRVMPGADYDMVCDQISTALLQLRNVETGRPAVRDVVRSFQIFRGEHVHNLPDLYVLWNREAPIRGVESETLGRIIGELEHHRTGDHRPDCFWLVNGPTFSKRGFVQSCQPADVGATVLSFFGIDEGDYDGQSAMLSHQLAKKGSRPTY